MSGAAPDQSEQSFLDDNQARLSGGGGMSSCEVAEPSVELVRYTAAQRRHRRPCC